MLFLALGDVLGQTAGPAADVTVLASNASCNQQLSFALTTPSTAKIIVMAHIIAIYPK